jgi:hypothetical protein
LHIIDPAFFNTELEVKLLDLCPRVAAAPATYPSRQFDSGPRRSSSISPCFPGHRHLPFEVDINSIIATAFL